MAWVSTGWSMKVKLVDSGGNEGSVNYQMTAIDHATAILAAPVILGYLEAVCAAGTLSYTITETFANDAFVLPAAGVQIEAKALLVMRDETNPIKKHIARIPAPETDVFLALTGDGANIVDIAHIDVLDYANMFSTGGECYISDGERIQDNGLLEGRRVTHRSRRG